MSSGNLLSKLHTAVVVADALAPDYPDLCQVAQEYFARHGFELRFIAINKHTLVLRRTVCDLLVCTTPERNWRTAFLMRRSRTTFTAGRWADSKMRPDLVVTQPAGSGYGQVDAFRQMCSIFEKIEL